MKFMGQQATAGEQKSSAVASAAAEPEGLEELAAKDVGQKVSGRRRYVRHRNEQAKQVTSNDRQGVERHV